MEQQQSSSHKNLKLIIITDACAKHIVYSYFPSYFLVFWLLIRARMSINRITAVVYFDYRLHGLAHSDHTTNLKQNIYFNYGSPQKCVSFSHLRVVFRTIAVWLVLHLENKPTRTHKRWCAIINAIMSINILRTQKKTVLGI